MWRLFEPTQGCKQTPQTNKKTPKNVKVKLMFCPLPSSNTVTCYYPLSRLTYLYLFIDSVRTGIDCQPTKRWLHYFPSSLRCKALVSYRWLPWTPCLFSCQDTLHSFPVLFPWYSSSGALLPFALTIVPTSQLPCSCGAQRDSSDPLLHSTAVSRGCVCLFPS